MGTSRKEIENRWQRRTYKGGSPLCIFLNRCRDMNTQCKILKMEWDTIWETQDHTYMSFYFIDGWNREELSYLCRALSLHMLLDDNGVK